MTHNKYFFSGRLEGVRQTPEGGNLPQDFAPEEVEGGPHEKDVLPLATTSDPFGAASYNINPMLLEAIRMSDLFWNLPQFRTFSEVIDQIYYTVKYATPWVPGTHGKKSTGMQSAVRGVSNAGTPGVSYTMLLKLFVLKLTRDQIKTMLEHPDSPYIRCLGFLYLRIGMSSDGFKDLWTWCEPYLGDREEFCIDGTPATKTTIGEFVRRILTDQDFFGDRLPRFPVLLSRTITANIESWLASGGAQRGGREGAEEEERRKEHERAEEEERNARRARREEEEERERELERERKRKRREEEASCTAS